MGFHINKKTEAKNVSKNTKGLPQAGASKFIAKSNTKSSGAMKKPIKTGGARGSWLVYQKHKKTTYEINRKWFFLFSIIYFNKTGTEVATEFSGYMEGAVF